MPRFLNGAVFWVSERGLTVLAIAVAVVVAGYGAYFYVDQYRPFGPGDSTLSSLRGAVEKRPADVMGRIRLATGYIDAGMYDAAEAEFLELLKADAGFSTAVTGLGLVYFKQGKYPQALEQFDEIIRAQEGTKYAELSADLNNAYYYTGVIFMKTGRLNESEQRLRGAILTNPADGEARMYLGWVMCQLGRCQEGLSETNFAVLFDPENPEPHYYQGLVLEKMGQKADAATELSLALKYRSDFAEASEALRRVKGG